jgi:hypothetical protein
MAPPIESETPSDSQSVSEIDKSAITLEMQEESDDDEEEMSESGSELSAVPVPALTATAAKESIKGQIPL